MQKIFIEKPYQFVQPLMWDWLAKLMNNRLVHIPLLRFSESIVSVESRGVERLKNSIDAGHAIILIPNHPRTSDPVVLYDVMRRVGKPMFAMASWHLFNHGWHNRAIIRLYGGYSVNREGLDKSSVSFSVKALQDNVRPLLMFPEGATSRTNDTLMPFLDGPTFIARTAARRRSKLGLKTVIHPIAIRYMFDGDFKTELNRLLDPVDEMFGGESTRNLDAVPRVRLALSKLVARKAARFDVELNPELGAFEQRQAVLQSVMNAAEMRCFGASSSESISDRIRNVRTSAFPEILNNKDLSEADRQIRWLDLERTYLAWQMASYPEGYLDGNPSIERILDIAAKVNEDLTDVPRRSGRQRVVVEVCDPIEVPASKHRGDKADPLVAQIEEQLKERLEKLENELCPARK